MNRRYMCTYENGRVEGGGGLREVRLLHNRKTRTAGVITGGNSSYCLALLIACFPMQNAMLFKGPPSCEQPVVRLPTAKKSTVIIQIYGSMFRNPAWFLKVSDHNIDRFFFFYLCTVHTAVCTTKSTHSVSRHADKSPHNIQLRNFTECFNRCVTLARLCTSSLRRVEDRNM